jgi:hypothetical protein
MWQRRSRGGHGNRRPPGSPTMRPPWRSGLGVRAAATALGLGFVPVTWEDFDIVLSGDALPAAEPLIVAEPLIG